MPCTHKRSGKVKCESWLPHAFLPHPLPPGELEPQGQMGAGTGFPPGLCPALLPALGSAPLCVSIILRCQPGQTFEHREKDRLPPEPHLEELICRQMCYNLKGEVGRRKQRGAPPVPALKSEARDGWCGLRGTGTSLPILQTFLLHASQHTPAPKSDLQPEQLHSCLLQHRALWKGRAPESDGWRDGVSTAQFAGAFAKWF